MDGDLDLDLWIRLYEEDLFGLEEGEDNVIILSDTI